MLYRCDKSYDWNYRNAPQWDDASQAQLADSAKRLALTEPLADYAGIPVRAPVAIAAGPLLNGRWCLAYAAQGFEIVTYKTVRSEERACYPLPNLTPVELGEGRRIESTVNAAREMRGSWAVSFGMPSRAPSVWQADIAWTREQLPSTHVLAVSVVGSAQEGEGVDELAQDYARCSVWAAKSGANVIELNFSCPNVCSVDGQLFQMPNQARQVAETTAESLAGAGCNVPLLVKIGYQPDDESLGQLIEALRPFVAGCVMTNSLPARVMDAEGQLMFGGQQRGICGTATLEPSSKQVARFCALTEHDSRFTAIGVGGVSASSDVERFRQAGASAVQIATSAMVDSKLADNLQLPGRPG